jgi:hypothetical protein
VFPVSLPRIVIFGKSRCSGGYKRVSVAILLSDTWLSGTDLLTTVFLFSMSKTVSRISPFFFLSKDLAMLGLRSGMLAL